MDFSDYSDGEVLDYYDYSSGHDEEEETKALDDLENKIKEDLEVARRAEEKKNYVSLNEGQIKKHVEDEIISISNIFSISRGSVCALLHHYAWKIETVQEKMFADEKKVRRTVGLSIEPELDNLMTEAGKKYSRKVLCHICFDEIDKDMMFSAACGEHMFCTDCWKPYISTSIDDGVGCLTLRCPEPSCKAIVDSDMIDVLASSKDKVKYYNYLYRSYVEDNVERKWCPAPGCDYAVQLDRSGSVSEGCDVACDCSYVFCFDCCEEKHRPMDCETVGKWIKKNSSESENSNWILAYTKHVLNASV